MSSVQEINEYIDRTNLKNKEDLVSVFKELVVKYPEETERQHSIRGMIMLFERKYPAEMLDHKKAIKVVQEQKINEFASNDEADMRLAFRIPQSLMTRINMVVKAPPFLTEESDKMFGEINWFRQEFPRYAVTNVS